MKDQKINQWGWIIVGIFALALEIFLIFYTYWHRHYLVPPGNDVITHYGIIQNILETGKINFGLYPPGFHLIVIALSRLFHQSIWTILASWTPVLIVLPALAMFFLLRQLFSLRVSILTSAILLLTSGYPLYAFVDGNYPDMLAYGVFGVLLFAFLIRFYRTGKYLNLIWSGIFLLLIAFTHSLTFFNIFGILLIFGLWQFYQSLHKSKIQLEKKIFLGFGAILLIAAIGYLLASRLYGSTALQFISGVFHNQPFLKNTYLNTILNYEEYPRFNGSLIWYFGLAGFFYILIASFAKKEKSKSKQLIIVWLLFLYLLSRLSVSGFPGRFVRELALPLTVSTAFLFDYLIERNLNRQRLGQILAFGLIGYLIIINSALYTGLDKIPNGFIDQIWYWPVDQQKVDFLSQNIPKNQIVLYNPNANLFFPVKSTNNLMSFELATEQMQVANAYLNDPEKSFNKTQYNQLVNNLKERYQNVDYIFDDVKPPGNTEGAVYPAYAHYQENKIVLEGLASSGKVIKTFPDSATIYRMK